MKQGKKILSLVMAVIVLLSIAPVAYAGNMTYAVGDIIQFGSYPQTQITDATLVSELNALAPEWDSWASYGYYSGDSNFGSMKPGDWMRYTDVTYCGNMYRGVKFTSLRPAETYFASGDYNSYQRSNGYNTNTVYWFKYEPIDWIVLDPINGFVMSEKIIDSQPFSNTVYYDRVTSKYYNDSSYTNDVNDYETSSIKKWLNNDFYNIAFTAKEKSEIKVSNDKVFLLSDTDVLNSDFGFDERASVIDWLRCAYASDYSKSQGLKTHYAYNTGGWILSTPAENMYGNNSLCCAVDMEGLAGAYCDVWETIVGIRPALKLEDISEITSHNHVYISETVVEPTCFATGIEKFTCRCCNDYYTEVLPGSHHYEQTYTLPTCTEPAYQTSTCVFCGDSVTVEISYIGAKGHIDENGDYICDNGCGYKFENDPPAPDPEDPEDPDMPITPIEPEEPKPEDHEHDYNDDEDETCNICGYDRTENCDCRCHDDSFFAKIFWKITNFFNKIFKKNKICDCGIAHY